MAAHVSFVEAAKMLGSGASFVVLATGLGLYLARLDITARDSAGRLRPKACALIALSFAILIFAHAMALWSLDLYHPAINVFYLASAGIAVAMTHKKPATSGPRPR